MGYMSVYFIGYWYLHKISIQKNFMPKEKLYKGPYLKIYTYWDRPGHSGFDIGTGVQLGFFRPTLFMYSSFQECIPIHA